VLVSLFKYNCLNCKEHIFVEDEALTLIG